MPDGGEALLDCGSGKRIDLPVAKPLYVAGNIDRLDVGNRTDATFLAEGQKLAYRLRIGPAGIAIADIGREEF